MEELAEAHIIIEGRVQGVGFRFYILRLAEAAALKGYVRNLYDGNVEIEVEGERETIKTFLEKLQGGSMKLYIKDLDIRWSECKNKHAGFNITF